MCAVVGIYVSTAKMRQQAMHTISSELIKVIDMAHTAELNLGDDGQRLIVTPLNRGEIYPTIYQLFPSRAMVWHCRRRIA
ncbi:MAG TPA: hypothetical protein VGT08_17990 [Terracidiphilus sp.]|nr:hypothetical protein [Terracidiphilus sp.]